MHYNYQRQVSLFALWSWRIASFTFLLFAVVSFCYLFGIFTGRLIYAFFLLIAILCIVAIIFAVLGLISLWKNGELAGRYSLLGGSLATIIFILVSLALKNSFSSAADISTNLTNPPKFIKELVPISGKYPLNNNEINNELLLNKNKDLEPISGHRYSISANEVASIISNFFNDKKWVVDREDISINGKNYIFLQTQIKYLIFPHVADIIIRMTDEGTTSYLDLRSIYSRGEPDFGMNKYLVNWLLSELDQQIIFSPLLQKDNNFILNNIKVD